MKTNRHRKGMLDPGFLNHTIFADVMPCQVPTHGEGSVKPEVMMWLALMEGVCNCLKKKPYGKAGERAFDETVEWIKGAEGAPMPFERLCDYLNLNVEVTRRKLLEAEHKTRMGVKGVIRGYARGYYHGVRATLIRACN